MATLRQRWPWLVLTALLLATLCGRADYVVRQQARVQADRLAQQLAVGPGANGNPLDLSWLALYPEVRSAQVATSTGEVLGRYARSGESAARGDGYRSTSGRDGLAVEISTDLPGWPATSTELPLLLLATFLLSLAIPLRGSSGAPQAAAAIPAQDALSLLTPPSQVPASLVLELDAGMRIQRVSRGLERFGYAAEQLMGLPVSDFIERFHPGSPQSHLGVHHADGGQLDSLVSSASIQDDGGGLEKVVVTLAPPGSTGLEARYSSLQRLCQAICDHARDAVVIVDASGSLVYANLAFRAICNEQGAAGQSLLGLVRPEHRLILADAIVSALDGGHDTSLEMALEAPSTGILEGAFHVLTPAGEKGGSLVVGIFREVSMARRLAEELERARQRAGHSQKIEALGRMAGGVAHDFNNLLATIVFNLEAARAALDPDDPALPYLEEMHLATNRACSVTRQLLTYSRKKPAELCRVSCHQVIADAERLTQSTRGSVQVLKRLKAEADEVLLDDGQLDQVLVNLLVNAKDAIGDDGRIELTTRNCSLDEGRPGILIAVKDTGPGIPKEIQSKIFEPYFTTKEIGKGTGLGLSTAVAIVEKAGGQMSVSSSETGTCFEIRLPLAAESQLQPQPIETSPAPAPTDAAVLLVEDEAAIRNLLHRLLEQRGYRVTSAGSGADAAKILHDRPAFDVLVTDLVLPGLSGPELARMFQQSRPGGPVLFMSGFPGDTLDEAQAALNSRFLAKPFSPEQLLGSLRQLLGHSA